MLSDGMRLHRYQAAGPAEYEVHGHLIFKYMLSEEPTFEIRENWIYPYHVAEAWPVYEIRGERFVHEYMSTSEPVYEAK